MSDALLDAPPVTEQDDANEWLIAWIALLGQLRDMRPGYPLPYKSNNTPADTHGFGDCSSAEPCLCQFAYLANLGFGSRRIWIATALQASTFFDHIPAVVGGCSQEQVVRIDTGAVITFVADKHAFRNRAIVNCVGDAVSQIGLANRYADAITSALADYACPIPAFVRIASYALLLKCLFRGVVSVLVAREILALRAGICRVCYLLPTAALAVVWFRSRQRGVMPLEKAIRLSLDTALSTISGFREGSLLAASAMAITVWNFVGIVARGIILHSNVSLLDLLTPRDDSTHRRGNFIGCFCSFILAHLVEYCNV